MAEKLCQNIDCLLDGAGRNLRQICDTDGILEQGHQKRIDLIVSISVEFVEVCRLLGKRIQTDAIAFLAYAHARDPGTSLRVKL